MKPFSSSWDRFKAHFQAWFKDHEIIRIAYRNFHTISPKAYRSSHPSARFIRKLHKNGLKTIISMRTANTSGQYRLEKEACDQLNITLLHHPMSSRRFPTSEEVLEAKRILESAEYPILIHCKSGADRAGLMSVFYELFIEKKPIEEALKQLSMKYGHFRWADTGKLDLFFEAYLDFSAKNPNTEFLDWVENHYDINALQKQFHSQKWANVIVNKILKRE